MGAWATLQRKGDESFCVNQGTLQRMFDEGWSPGVPFVH